MCLEHAAGSAMEVPWGHRVTGALFVHNGSRNKNVIEARDSEALLKLQKLFYLSVYKAAT